MNSESCFFPLFINPADWHLLLVLLFLNRAFVVGCATESFVPVYEEHDSSARVLAYYKSKLATYLTLETVLSLGYD